MSADVLSKWGLLINTNLLLERGIFDREFGLWRLFEQIEAEPMLGELNSVTKYSPSVRQTNSPPK
jgi:hypothetical protein